MANGEVPARQVERGLRACAVVAAMVTAVAQAPSSSSGAAGPRPSSCGLHVRSGGGHVEVDSAASPKKLRRRAG
ncbi:hypothetical protein CHLRE_01g034875v5 [Chlamydomonas reinhardtii]|uniref:Uncharacterized protein n=1 Tax=Chlamydomonas reinhardtii TaxID=3055 RepID=A0A2K3E6Z3_CHLRE|nr:uncharacterized protein CHLRE_01g034875v5 [Chlamydomonas reinhardtii]PNW88565.1 hypothetical protein CHLRE_01g034875v5 [Chlamydomonas reinhardtii]